MRVDAKHEYRVTYVDRRTQTIPADKIYVEGEIIKFTHSTELVFIVPVDRVESVGRAEFPSAGKSGPVAA